MSGKRAARKVACPACGEASEFTPANPWRPFCSERCRTLDLGAWASESYRIPARPVPQDPSSEGSGDDEPR